ncbi:hypothetical protein K469DRAFT_648111 [Zopfia rhizophila CBS 207.26]|uniref:Fungal-type protein kinase domain-containing protein n=1 Tax=Zopfia rhizophila CBS 207.26 TaxID=1314779 RepID=A0A6A6D5E5_9PEZI|nr:hypothetical protein K469DRAFT_648111 [Zopfia rhizophila CBS 207.26]
MVDGSTSEIIKTAPIGDGLNAFRDSFRSFCKTLGVPSSLQALDQIGSEDLQTLALTLISALQILPASRQLCSSRGGKNLLDDLSKLMSAVNSDDFDIERIIPLLKAVLSKESDEVIWDKVYAAVIAFTAFTVAKPTTPPQSGPPLTSSFQQTPWTFNTGSFADTSDLRKDVDPILKSEVEDNLRIDHPNVFTTFFGQIPRLHDIATAVFQSCKDAEPPLYKEDVGWLEWLEACKEACEEEDVLKFLRRHINQFLLFADERGFRPSKRRRCITTPNKPIPGSVSKRKLDIGLAYNPNNKLEDSDRQSCDWSHILIPGELKSNPREDNYSSTWLDLLRYAREIFSAQNTRRFVLGFTLCGSTMRLWEFDRLGVVGSTPFDVNKDGQMFVSAILGYLWMSEEELGFDSTIVDDGGRYTQIQRGGRMERLYLEELIKRQRSVAGRATTCWRGSLEDRSEGGFVIKDSWEFEERPEEGFLLKEATEAGVKNVARYYHHETVHTGDKVDDVRHNVRKGLNDTGGRNPFQRRPTLPEDVTSPTTSSGSRPGRDRSRSTSRTITRKRSSSCVQTSMPPPKRSCSDSPVKQGAQERRNRVHRRLIMRDIGKNVYEASSLQAVLRGLLGGIKGHESLLDAKILHRDISIGNIMLKMGEDDGFLIDLDLAIKLDRQKASGAPSKTGTKVFMAIGTLYGDEDHSFMHDLESFFWVLFWICVHWNGPGLPRNRTEYDSWNYEPTQKLAEIKKGKVDEEDKFTKEVMKKFTVHCKPLVPCVQELRKVVFPDGKRWLREDRQLYSYMKSVLEQALKNMGTLE